MDMEQVRKLIKQRDETVDEIKRIVWESEYPNTPYDPDVAFPWKKILRGHDLVI